MGVAPTRNPIDPPLWEFWNSEQRDLLEPSRVEGRLITNIIILEWMELDVGAESIGDCSQIGERRETCSL